MQIKHYIEVDGEVKRIKDRIAAGILAIMGGWFGLHKFYNGRILAAETLRISTPMRINHWVSRLSSAISPLTAT